MTLLNAPEYDPTTANRLRNIGIGVAVTLALLVVLSFLGYVLGHGWLFSNLGYEHRVNNFFNALQAKDYPKAFAIYNNDPEWQQHPQKYADYPLPRFIDDWTTHSPVNAPILNHHVDISRTDGSGLFGSGVIVAVRINGDHPIFMYVNRADKTMTWPAIHELKYQYNP